MHVTEEEKAPSKKRFSTPAMIVIGIVLISLAFLAFPSSRTVRVRKAKEVLAKDYAGPKDLSYLYGGYFVTLENKPVKLDLASEAQILVFAPRPKDSFSSNLVNQLEVTYFGNESERKPIHVCLLAPDPTSTGWTMFARVWIAKTLQRKLTQQIARSLCQSMFSNPSATIKQLNDYWKEIPASIQKQADDVLVRNREVAKKLPGVHRYFQDGKGTNYEIDVSTNIWNFKNTFNEAHPERQLNR